MWWALRWLVNTIAFLVLLLCLASAALWLRSSFRSDCVSHTFPSGRFAELSTYWGQFTLITAPRAIPPNPSLAAPPSTAVDDTQPQTSPRGGLLWATLSLSFPTRSTCAGVTLTRGNGPTGTIAALHAPLWLPTATLALLPACWLATARINESLRRRRQHLNVCRQCGYDLTGNVSGTCPECGRACELSCKL